MIGPTRKRIKGPRKTMVNLWFVHGIEMSAMIEALKSVKKSDRQKIRR